MSTHNICFHGELRNFSNEKSALSVAMTITTNNCLMYHRDMTERLLKVTLSPNQNKTVLCIVLQTNTCNRDF